MVPEWSRGKQHGSFLGLFSVWVTDYPSGPKSASGCTAVAFSEDETRELEETLVKWCALRDSNSRPSGS